MSGLREAEVPCRDTDPIPKTPPEEEEENVGDMKQEEEDGPASLGGGGAQGPTAFTIDFDDGPRKKLGLKDGIRHFAPSKKAQGRPATAKMDRENNNSINAAEMAAQQQQQKQQQHKTTKVIEIGEKEGGKADADGGDSDAGTYTIEDEEGGEGDGEAAESERRNIDTVFRVEQAELSSSEWVSQWATSSSVPASATASAASTSPTERARRKLPATPPVTTASSSRSPVGNGAAAGAGAGGHSSAGETENYLQDTISVMAAMEARIGSATEKGGTKKAVARTSSSSKITAANNGNSKEEQKMAWERRKNYDPLRASGRKGESASPQHLKALSKTAPGAVFMEESCSDSYSEVEATKSVRAKTTTTPLTSTRQNRAFALRRKLNSVEEDKPVNGASTDRLHPLPRGDAGRSSLRGRPGSSSAASSSAASRNLARRTVSDGRSSSSLSSKEAEFQAWKRRKNYNPMRSKLTGTAASTTTTSPPSQRHRQPTSPRSLNVMSTSLNRPSALQNGLHHKRAPPRRGDVVAMADDDDKPMQRSASFHYPDGLSRTPHNVYSSEDESSASAAGAEPDYSSLQGWTSVNYAGDGSSNQLLEVNDDEFILAIGGGGGGGGGSVGKVSNGSVRSGPRSAGSGGASVATPPHQRTSPRRMEALDNLVISTIFSLSTKLCATSANLIKSAQSSAVSEEQQAIMDTLVYVLEETDAPASPAKKTSRELAGTLRNLKKVEQALRALECASYAAEDDAFEEDDDDDADDEHSNVALTVRK